MGWRDRDYAKWTDEERRRFLGSDHEVAFGGHGGRHTARGGSLHGYAARRSRVGVNGAALLAVLLSGAALALGQFPRGHPLVPTLHFKLPGIGHRVAPPTKPAVFSLNGPTTATVGSTLTLRGSSSSSVTGVVTITGSYGDGWKTLATTAMQSGSYQAQVKLWRRGRLRLRVTYPDGSKAVGTITVLRTRITMSSAAF
jgi:hypothetical protein